MRTRLVLGIALTLIAWGCRPAKTTVAPLLVFAAADLAFPFQAIEPAFERKNGGDVTLVLGSTGNLAMQIAQGAPADVFFAADESFLDGLESSGLLVPDSRVMYAQGRIVLARGQGVNVNVRTLDDLVNDAVGHVAIANPAHAPYGRAAEQALRAAGIWERVQPRLVYGENIRQALQYVESGAAGAGIVALSVVNVPGIEWTPIDESLYQPLKQAAAIVRSTRSLARARAFLDYIVHDPAGRETMKRFGFRLPGER